MPRKRADAKEKKNREQNEIALEPIPQPITETIVKNYMPYVMSVMVSRAIPEIDGFKPSHRRILYTMYTMGLMNGARTKSSNVVGQTMHLNPHGDMSIYETLVRLTRGNECLLHPFIDSKGSFGKQYSRDMAFAAPRYTEVKLDSFCSEIFRGIDKDAVDMIPNYDNTTTEPTLLPTTFPNILATPNTGIAVGMATSICSFNLAELCDATTILLKHPAAKLDTIMDVMKAPDFSLGAYIIYDKAQMAEIYRTGRGSFKMRARYSYDKAANCIEILQIPYSTCIEAIMQKLTELMKAGKLKDISDFRDEIDLSGFKLTIDLRRGADPDLVMAKLYKLTKLEDSFDCNFNLLIDGAPRQLGVIEIISEWIKFRVTTLRRELSFELKKKQDKLHLLLALGKILLDIDKAIAIVKNSEHESDVVPNLMKEFSIDEIQAEYIAEIKLRHLNREYILNRIKEIEDLRGEIAGLDEIIGDELKLKSEIAKQLAEVKKKFGIPRKTQLMGCEEITEIAEGDMIENFNVKVLMTAEGYFKKITLLSWRGNDEQKLKEGDRVAFCEDCENISEVMFITNKCQLYKAKISDFDCVKASLLGDFIPAKLKMDDGERPVMMKIMTPDLEKHNFIFIFENGKGVRVPVSSYQIRANRRRLSGVYSSASPIVAAFYEDAAKEIIMVSSVYKAITIKSTLIPEKPTRTANGVTLFDMKKKAKLVYARTVEDCEYENPMQYRKIKIPATGSLLNEKDIAAQQLKI